ncbi:unnamed protein product [Rotaria socialis]
MNIYALVMIVIVPVCISVIINFLVYSHVRSSTQRILPQSITSQLHNETIQQPKVSRRDFRLFWQMLIIVPSLTISIRSLAATLRLFTDIIAIIVRDRDLCRRFYHCALRTSMNIYALVMIVIVPVCISVIINFLVYSHVRSSTQRIQPQSITSQLHNETIQQPKVSRRDLRLFWQMLIIVPSLTISIRSLAATLRLFTDIIAIIVRDRDLCRRFYVRFILLKTIYFF